MEINKAVSEEKMVPNNKPVDEKLREIRQNVSTPLEIRQEEDKKTKIVGYAVEWDKLSNPILFFREKFRKGAFAKSLINGDVRALWQHDTSKVLGRTKNGTLSLIEDDTGLRYEIIPPDTTWGMDAVESIRRGDVSESSFGFIAIRDEWDDTDPNTPIRTVVEADLIEISPISFAAYPQTSVGVRSAMEVYETHACELEGCRPGDSEPEFVPDKKTDIRRKKLDLLLKF